MSRWIMTYIFQKALEPLNTQRTSTSTFTCRSLLSSSGLVDLTLHTLRARSWAEHTQESFRKNFLIRVLVSPLNLFLLRFHHLCPGFALRLAVDESRRVKSPPKRAQRSCRA